MAAPQGGSLGAGLERNAANYAPLTPVSFLQRSADVYPGKPAVIHGDRTYTYREFHERCRRLASVLAARGIGHGDTVAIMAPNVPALLECHYAVPGLGAVLNALNYRLDAASIAFCLEHGEAKVLITDKEFSAVVGEALARLEREIFVVDIDDALGPGGRSLGGIDYESWIATGDPAFELMDPADEWDSLALLYTSGTTGNPKGVVYHHRGAYLNALGNALAF
ncbi:MAG TPA: AMP-binding protein, partial [Usitatibacter sp.]|nr:AMP-binding protein [Usitatibacter sp.]